MRETASVFNGPSLCDGSAVTQDSSVACGDVVTVVSYARMTSAFPPPIIWPHGLT